MIQGTPAAYAALNGLLCCLELLLCKCCCGLCAPCMLLSTGCIRCSICGSSIWLLHILRQVEEDLLHFEEDVLQLSMDQAGLADRSWASRHRRRLTAEQHHNRPRAEIGCTYLRHSRQRYGWACFLWQEERKTRQRVPRVPTVDNMADGSWLLRLLRSATGNATHCKTQSASA